MAHGSAKAMIAGDFQRRNCRNKDGAVRSRICIHLAALAFVAIMPPGRAWAIKTEEVPVKLSLERYAQLGEADRYQFKIAEDYFAKKNWAVAAAEYEKFLTLYEASEGASHAQLKWSLCQVNLRKLNTAIKDGYQSVIDYWPDSADAVLAAYLIANTYREMGEIKQAQKYYAKVLTDYPDHYIAVLSKVDLATIAKIESDSKRRIALLDDLTYKSSRAGDAKSYCINASHELANHHFYQGDFAGGLKDLQTSYSDAHISAQLANFVREPIYYQVKSSENNARGLKLADAAIAYVREKMPESISDDASKSRTRHLGYQIAEIQQAAVRINDALEVYEQLIKRLGVDDDLLSHKANFYMGQGRRDDARKIFGQYANQISGQSNIARSYREEGKSGLAVPIYQNLITQDAKNAANWQWELATTLRDSGKHKEAIAAFRQCDRYPEDTRQIAGCYVALREYNEALALYGQLLSHDASAPSAQLSIARTLEAAGQKEKAIKAFQIVCKRYSTSHEASLAHAHLQNVYKINTTLGGATAE